MSVQTAPGSSRSLAAIAALIAVMVVAVGVERQVSIGRDEVAEAEASAVRSDWPDAIAHARAAAEALVPGSPWPDRGKFRLQAIGRDAEARGDDDTARMAYGALLTASVATRASIWSSPSSERWRSTAAGGLARVAAQHEGVRATQISTDSMLDELRDAQSPGTWTFALLAAASLAVVGALARIAWLGDSGRGARGTKAVAVLGFVAYAIILLMR
jgi:hypothetical protein